MAFAEELLQEHLVAAAAQLQALAQGDAQQANGLSRKVRIINHLRIGRHWGGAADTPSCNSFLQALAGYW